MGEEHSSDWHEPQKQSCMYVTLPHGNLGIGEQLINCSQAREYIHFDDIYCLVFLKKRIKSSWHQGKMNWCWKVIISNYASFQYVSQETRIEKKLHWVNIENKINWVHFLRIFMICQFFVSILESWNLGAVHKLRHTVRGCASQICDKMWQGGLGSKKSN